MESAMFIALVQYVFIVAVIGLTFWAVYAVGWHLAFDNADKVHRGRLLRKLGFPRHQFKAPIGLTVFAPRKKNKGGQRAPH